MKLLLTVVGVSLSMAPARAQIATDTERPYPEDRLTVAPLVLREPALVYPDRLRHAGIGGTVHVGVVLDPKGRPEPASVHVVSSPDTGLNAAACEVVLGARFSPGRLGDRRVRASLEFEVLFDPLDTTTGPPPPIYSEADSLGEKPALLRGPPVRYPEDLRMVGIQGRVMVQLVIDTLGHVEPASIPFVTSPDREFEWPVRAYLRRAQFRPARRNGQPVRSLVYLPFDFRIRGQPGYSCRPNLEEHWTCPS